MESETHLRIARLSQNIQVSAATSQPSLNDRFVAKIFALHTYMCT